MSTSFRLALATVLILVIVACLRYAPPAQADEPLPTPCPGVELMIQPFPLPSCPEATPAATPTPEQDIGTPLTFSPVPAIPDTAMEAPR